MRERKREKLHSNSDEEFDENEYLNRDEDGDFLSVRQPSIQNTEQPKTLTEKQVEMSDRRKVLRFVLNTSVP